MAWSDLTALLGVSFTNMQTSGISLKAGQSHTTSDELMTKAGVIAKYTVNEAKASLAAKGSNDIVVKQDLEAGDPATATLTITFESGKWYGFLSAAIPSAGISIQAGVARGYYDACLGAADETVDMWSDSGKVVLNGFSIPAGYLSNDFGSGGYDPFEDFSGSVINYNMINNIEINSVARTDGSTFTVGGTTVTLSLPLSCTPYS